MAKNPLPFSAVPVAVAAVMVVLLAATIDQTRAAAAAVVASDFESVNVGRLAELADEFRATVGPAEVRARFRTAAVPQGRAAAGCGYAFLANDDAALSAHVPRYERAACGQAPPPPPPPPQYRVQFVRPDAVYDGAVPVRVPVHNVTVTANGGDGLALDALCVGFGGAGGVQAFCVDRPLLDACVLRRKSHPFLGGGAAGVRLSRAFAGHAAPNCKEIGFRDVDGLARGFESLRRNATDGGAQTAVCSRIALLAESSVWAIDAAKCYAEKKHAAVDTEFQHVKIRADHLRDNCTRDHL